MVDMQFYEYVLKLLYESGHMITSDPVYANHSASEALYIDSSKNVAVSRFERSLLMQISNVSQLLEIRWPGVVDDLTENVQIYSITIDAPDRNRSQIVADVHRLLHRYWNCHHSIVFFNIRHQYIVSFANNDHSHILSDWYNINVDYDEVVEKIDVANISLENSSSYFSDFIRAIAREYYLYPISVEEATYSMIPLTFVASAFGVKTEASKDDIKAIAKANLLYYETLYGDDYVAPILLGYDEQAQFQRMAAELDRISFELELAAELDDVDNGAIFDDDDGELDGFDDDFDEVLDDDLDPAIFDDPVLMVKWLERQEKRATISQEIVLAHTEQNGQEHSDAECVEDKCRNITERVAKLHEEVEPRCPDCREYEQREHNRLEEEQRRNEQKHLYAVHKRQIADQKRRDAEQKRSTATQKRSNAEHLESELLTVQAQIAQKRTEADRAEWLRIETATTYCEYCQHELSRKRREANEKRCYARELRDTAISKRKEAERLNLEFSSAECQKKEKRRIAEYCMQVWLEAECIAQQEALQLEQKRIAEEHREKQRIAELQQRCAELEAKHKNAVVNIWNRYNGEQSQITAELANIEKRLGELKARISSLGFIQFSVKKELRAEQAEMLSKRTQLEYQYTDLESRYKRQLAEEQRRFENEKLTLGL